MWIEEMKTGAKYACAKIELTNDEVRRISHALYDKFNAESNKTSDYSKELRELQLQFEMLQELMSDGVISEVVAKKYGDLKYGKDRELK